MADFYSAPSCTSFGQRASSSAPTEQAQYPLAAPWHVPPAQRADDLAPDIVTPLWMKVVREVRLYPLLTPV